MHAPVLIRLRVEGTRIQEMVGHVCIVYGVLWSIWIGLQRTPMMISPQGESTVEINGQPTSVHTVTKSKPHQYRIRRVQYWNGRLVLYIHMCLCTK